MKIIPDDLYELLQRIDDSFDGCDCACVEAQQDKHGFWTPKHECIPCAVTKAVAKYHPVTRHSWCASLDYGETPDE